MEAKTLTISDTGGTDHLSFDGVGIPGFQFIQDEIDVITSYSIHYTKLYDSGFL